MSLFSLFFDSNILLPFREILPINTPSPPPFPSCSTGAVSIALAVPQQPVDSNDCALFLLTFVEFFFYAQLRNDRLRDLAQALQLLASTRGGATAQAQLQDHLVHKYPGFLTPSWFYPDNPGLMRERIRYDRCRRGGGALGRPA